MTVSKGYQQLREEGYLITDRRRGTLVAPLPVKLKNNYEKNLTLLLAELSLTDLDEHMIQEKIKTILTSFREEDI